MASQIPAGSAKRQKSLRWQRLERLNTPSPIVPLADDLDELTSAAPAAIEPPLAPPSLPELALEDIEIPEEAGVDADVATEAIDGSEVAAVVEADLASSKGDSDSGIGDSTAEPTEIAEAAIESEVMEPTALPTLDNADIEGEVIDFVPVASEPAIKEAAIDPADSATDVAPVVEPSAIATATTDELMLVTATDAPDATEPEAIGEDDTDSDSEDLLQPISLPELDPLFKSGIFTVGNSGTVAIDVLWDGGQYQGQAGIFSLSGLETYELGSADFIAEVARRVTSNSVLGHLIWDDTTEAARFSGEMGGETNFNTGSYAGVKTFQMTAGDTFGVVLAPDATFGQLLSQPGAGSSWRPLFSMATANPTDGFQMGQIADVTGDGNTFTFEDLRVDRGGDKDYNDFVFQVRGATGEAVLMDEVVAPGKDWRSTDAGQLLVSYAEQYVEAPIEGSLSPIPDGFAGDDGLLPAPTDNLPLDFEPFVGQELPNPADGFLPDTELALPGSLPTYTETRFEFAPEHQPVIGVIDTGFAGNNPDFKFSNITWGKDYVSGDLDPTLAAGEGSQHGTHILGVIAAQQDNGIGIDGINPDAPIYATRAIGSGAWAEALTDTVDHIKASGQPNGVVNLSLDLTQQNSDGSITTRYEFTPEERAAIEYARQNGVVLVVAAGNDGGVMSVLGQASQEFDNIVTVGAVDRTNGDLSLYLGTDRVDYASYGDGLTVVADGGTPENPVLSTVDDGVGTMAGTSVATARVTGVVSQIWAANPELSYRQVIDILKQTATDLGATGWDAQTGAGLVNLAAAISLARMTVGSQESLQRKLFSQDLPEDEMSSKLTEVFAQALPGWADAPEFSPGDLEQLTNEEREVYQEVVQDVNAVLSSYISLARQKHTLEYAEKSLELEVQTLEELLETFNEQLPEVILGAQEQLLSFGARTPVELGIAALTWSGASTLLQPTERAAARIGVPAFNARILNSGYVSQVGFLRIRSGPGTNYSQVGLRYPGDVITFDAYEDAGSWVPDPFMPGGGSSRWYKIAGTDTWMSALYFDYSPEQAAQERARQEATQRAEQERRRAEEELRRAQEELRRAEEASRRAVEEARQRALEEAARRRAAEEAKQRALEEAIRRAAEEARQRALEEEVRRREEQNQQSAAVSTQSRPAQKHIDYERLSKQAAYQDLKQGDSVQGYKVDRVFQDSITGLFAVGLIPEGQSSMRPPVLLFRGTEPTTLQDLLTDADARGVGFGQHIAAKRAGIGEWLQKQPQKADITGHSLGGALAQMAASEYSGSWGETVTFNSPGVNAGFSEKPINAPVTHYFSTRDVVSAAGQRFLRGRVIEVTLPEFKGNPLNPLDYLDYLNQQHLQTFLHDPNVVCYDIQLNEIPLEDLNKNFSRYFAEGVRTALGYSPAVLGMNSVQDLNSYAAYLKKQVIEDSRAKIQQASASVSSFFEKTLEAAQLKAQAVEEKARQAVQTAKNLYQAAESHVQKARAAYEEFRQETQQRITQVATYSQQKIQESAQRLAQSVQQVGTKAAQVLTSYIKTGVNVATQVINRSKQVLSSVLQVGQQVVNRVVETGKKAFEAVKSSVVKVAQFASNTISAAGNAITNTVNQSISAGQKLASQAVNAVSSSVNQTVSAVKNGWNRVTSLFSW